MTAPALATAPSTAPTTAAATNPAAPSSLQAGIAQPSTFVSTPTGTIAITLTPPPLPTMRPWENAVLWVAIISFIGVLVSLWQANARMRKELDASDARLKTELAASDERLKTQLIASAEEATTERNQSREQANLDRQHATDQAHQERITKARREVYLELISEMTKAQFAISQFPAQDVRKLEVQAGFGGLIAATSKISILGEMHTVKKSRELLSAINESTMRMLPLLVPMSEQKDNEVKLREENAKHRNELIRVEFELKNKQMHYSTETHLLANEWKERNDEISKNGEEILAANRAFHAAHRIYSDTLLEESKAISVKVDELVSVMRDELGLITSLPELRASSEAMHTAARSAIAALNEGFN